MSKELDFIKNFSKINVSSICRKLKINRSNLLNGHSKSNEIKVKEEIESQVAKLYYKGE